MSGTINISRDLWDDTAFAAEKFSEREAWIWLIAEASWKPRTRRIGKIVVETKRGQVAGSVRFFADAFGWSKSRFDRFLGRLSERDMVMVDSGTGINVITICKYDDYQSKPKSSGTAAGQQRDSSGTAAGQQRDKREEGGNKGETIGGGGSAQAREPDPPEPRRPPPPPADATFRERILTAMGADPTSGMIGPNGKRFGTGPDMVRAAKWRDDFGFTEDQIVQHISQITADRAAKDIGPPGSWAYFEAALVRLKTESAVAALVPKIATPSPKGRDHAGRTPSSRPLGDNRQFHEAATEYERRLAAGEIDEGPDPSDPFRGRG